MRATTLLKGDTSDSELVATQVALTVLKLQDFHDQDIWAIDTHLS